MTLTVEKNATIIRCSFESAVPSNCLSFPSRTLYRETLRDLIAYIRKYYYESIRIIVGNFYEYIVCVMGKNLKLTLLRR